MKKSAIEPSVTMAETRQMELIPIDHICLSPFNYRKHMNQRDLELFAEGVKLQGIISPVTVRRLAGGKFELVAGERRIRAARIAGLGVVPAVIQELSDKEVIELQLAENIQRENPHPLDEAFAIDQMLQLHKTIDEISARLGKSKQFVYSRLKLLSLIEPFRQLTLEDSLTMKQALEIAALDADGQQSVYENCMEDSKGKNVFNAEDLQYYINQCKYDLRNAPFNIKDKKLIAEKGACTSCPFNTATLKVLFPELAKEAKCTNKGCYEQKCSTHQLNELSKALNEAPPVALLFYGEPGEALLQLLSKIPAANELPRYRFHDVEELDTPQPPDKDDFEEEGEINEGEYEQALQEYQQEMEQYEKDIQSGEYIKGLLVSKQEIFAVWFNPTVREHSASITKTSVTAKQVQEAIKAGNATPELLQSEIQRIDQREKRALEIDQDKIQLAIHEGFSELLATGVPDMPLTAADQLAARLIIYQALDYSTRHRVEEILFPSDETEADLLNQLEELTEQQFGYLIRMAIAGKSESKYPKQDAARCLYKVAESAGVNVSAIEYAFEQKAVDRQRKNQQKRVVLQKKIASMISTK